MTAEKTVPDLYPSRVHAQPKIIERQDPVVYPNSFNGPLSDSDLSFFEENGYLFKENYFTPDEIRLLQEEMFRLLEACRGVNRPEIVLEPDGEEVRSVFAVHRDNPVFRSLSEHPKLVDAAKQILGSDVYIHQSRINFKPGFTGKEFPWHSDFETWHTEDGMPRMRALSCSVALSDNYPWNGSLMLIPGSHKYFVSCVGETPERHYESSLRRQEYGVPDQQSLAWLVKQSRIEQPTGKAGSVLFFDCNIMHGSNSNMTPYPRSNVFFVYNSVENRLVAPFAAKAPRPDFLAARN